VGNYYSEKLHAFGLYDVYDTAIERIRQYLEAEIDFVRRNLRGNERVLEIGAGYGRIMKELSPRVASMVGIDISEDSVNFGRDYLKDCRNCSLQVMDAHDLAFAEEFDVVLCLQNGLSALKGKRAPRSLLEGVLKTLVPRGKVYCSTYSPNFWEVRLAWFYEQAKKGLLGEIDGEATREGRVVCKDGFVSTSFSREELDNLGKALKVPYEVKEVDESSLFLFLDKEAIPV